MCRASAAARVASPARCQQYTIDIDASSLDAFPIRTPRTIHVWSLWLAMCEEHRRGASVQLSEIQCLRMVPSQLFAL